MLPGVDFTEMLLLVVLALVLLGPRELPLLMRRLGRFTGKMRALAFEFRQGFDELGRQAELEELRKEVAALKKTSGVDELQRELEEDQANLQKDIASAMAPVGLKPPGQAVPVPATPDESRPAPPPEPAGTAADDGTAANQPDAHEEVGDPADDFRIDAGHNPPPVKQDAAS